MKDTDLSLMGKILIMEAFLIGSILILFVGLRVRYSIQELSGNVDDNLSNVAQMLAMSDLVINALSTGHVAPCLNAYLDNLVKKSNNVDIISVADMNSVCIYHYDKINIGKNIYTGSEARALKGERYFGASVTGSLGVQRRYFCPVFNSDSVQIGFVAISILKSHLNAKRRDVLIMDMRDFSIVLFIGLLAAVFLTVSIKRSLLGYEPDQLRRVFVRQREIMDALEEGLLATDNYGKVIMINEAAERMLGLAKGTTEGRDVKTLLGFGDDNLLFSKVAIRNGKEAAGSVTILRDRTEVKRMAEQLTGVAHLLDALRAKTHEFKNQLHVILGMLQIGDADGARRCIIDIAQVQNEAVDSIVQKIENQSLAALLMGKISRCGELSIRIKISSKSGVPMSSRFLPSESIITIVGNLIENAIDAINEKNEAGAQSMSLYDMDGAQEILLLILEDENGLVINIDDTGIGMTEAEIQKLGTPGYSSKGENRGTGMGLIYSVLKNNGGAIEVDSEKGVGTSFSLSFRKPRCIRNDYKTGKGENAS